MEAITTTMDITSLGTIESEAGFLVGGDYGGNAVEVIRLESGLQCQCFIARVSHDDCEHIRAVRDYLASIPISEDRPMLSQADADYYLSKLGELDNTITGNIESANTQIDRIKLWLEMEDLKIQRKKDYYILALDNWMHLSGESTKRLVNGTLKVRAQQPDITIADEDIVLKNGRFTRLIPEKQTIDRAALRKHITSTGEEPEGVTVTVKPHKFSYIINRKEGA
jgi:hypothetical protein